MQDIIYDTYLVPHHASEISHKKSKLFLGIGHGTKRMNYAKILRGQGGTPSAKIPSEMEVAPRYNW